jgi:hypothetical protein
MGANTLGTHKWLYTAAMPSLVSLLGTQTSGRNVCIEGPDTVEYDGW